MGNDYAPFSSSTDLPSNDMMDQMLIQEAQKRQQEYFGNTLEQRVIAIEAKLEMLANILYQNREILKAGMIPDLGAGHKPPPIKKASFDDTLRKKDEQDRQVAEQGARSLIPIETKEGML
jgi:hypothetical protein|tara:strand:- start:39 stop:398 length:360 start_codon:yes stop_codon:yes gene_type:complete